MATQFYHEDKPHIWISIQSPGDPLPKFEDNPNRLAILFLEFADIDVPRDGYKIFDEGMALDVLEFVEEYKNQIDVIYCQCQGGISRSAGMAEALYDISNDNNKEIIGLTFMANRKVYRTIINTYEKSLPNIN